MIKMSTPTGLDTEVFFNKYQVCHELGQGAYGIVFQIKDKRDGQCYAAKHIQTMTQGDKTKASDELTILRTLKHPRVLELVEAYERPDEVVFVTDLLTGGALFERVVSEDFEFTEADSSVFIKQILQGLNYLHKNNIAHLDLKPENIVCINRSSMDLKIIDFGVAVFLQPGLEVVTGGGTEDYMAPEQQFYEPISTATDMWAVGVVCYILLSGLMPFTGRSSGETQSNIRDVNYCLDYPEFHWISNGAKGFISDLLKKDKEDRLTAEECLEHEWFQKQQSQQVINTDNLRNYVNRRKMKKCYNAIRAVNRIQKAASRKDLPAETENEDKGNSSMDSDLSGPKDEDEMKENILDHSKFQEDLIKEYLSGAKLELHDPLEVQSFDDNNFIKLVIDDTLPVKSKFDVTHRKKSPLKRLFMRLFRCFGRKNKYKFEH